VLNQVSTKRQLYLTLHWFYGHRLINLHKGRYLQKEKYSCCIITECRKPMHCIITLFHKLLHSGFLSFFDLPTET
jgi:hypothetical protein